MTTKRDCISCEYIYSRIDYGECGDCYNYSEWKSAKKREIKRRLTHLKKIFEEVESKP